MTDGIITSSRCCQIAAVGGEGYLATMIPGDKIVRCGVLLAINLLFLMIWGFAAIGKLVNGVPPWFADKFGKTLLATVPGLTATFWILALAELLAFLLAGLLALLRGEFLCRRTPTLLQTMLVWSLFVFVQLGFGQWLTAEYKGRTFQQFLYFCGTLIALNSVMGHRTMYPAGSVEKTLIS